MSILTGRAIQAAIECGDIRIAPFKSEQVNPNSYDVTLGNEFIEYTSTVLDVAKDNAYRKHTRTTGERIFLLPHSMILAHTVERIWSEKYVPIVDGKSSIGRLFTFIHVTAGYGELGFDDQYTLEIYNVPAIFLYAGMRIAQVRFQTIETLGEPISLYDGHYVAGKEPSGPVASRSWKQFAK